MDEAKEKKINIKASNVEACRICLATDTKMYSLQDTHLFTCMEAIVGFNKSYEGLPNYVCCECAPCLLKCFKLIEKSKTAEATLQDIFAKNGQINIPLIKEQNRTQLKLQSSIDSYLLLNYYYIKYDDDNNTSDFVNTESDPNEQINIKLKNEIKDEPSVNLFDEVSDSEILEIITDSINLVTETGKRKMSEKSESDSEVEAIEVDVPLIEINSDDEKLGDDFISLKSYSVKMDTLPQKKKLNNSEVPIYHVPKARVKRMAKKAKKKKKKLGRYADTLTIPNTDEKYVQKYFNIDEIPLRRTTNDKSYSCKSCFKTFDYVDEAKDHIILGCQKAHTSNSDSSTFPSSRPEANSTMTIQPVMWKVWPGESK